MAMVFLMRAAAASHKLISGFTSEAVDAMRAHPWPGNVRELSNRVRRAVVMAEGHEITPQDLDLVREEHHAGDSLKSLRAAHRRIEVEMLVRAISLHRGNLSRIARDLEIGRSTLYRKLRAYGLEKFAPSNVPPTGVIKTKQKKAMSPVVLRRA
jgi:two-component system NtrC family response regulator